MPVALPTELLPEILLNLDAYVSTLARCCLVSRTFRDCAQPILWHLIKVGSEEEAKVVLDALDGNDRLARFVKHLRVEPVQHSEEWDLAALFKALPELEDAWIGDVWPFEEDAIVALNGLKALRQLAILDQVMYFPDVLPSWPSFPHLTRLSLADVHLPPAYLTHLLTVAALPSLKALALGDLHDSAPDAIGSFFPTLPSDLLAQLTMLQTGQLHNDDSAHSQTHPSLLPANLDPRLVPLLVCTDYATVSQHNLVVTVPHVALHAGFTSGGWTQAIEAMRRISQTSTAIRSFWLPRCLHPSGSLDPDMALSWAAHEAMLRANGVEVNWLAVDLSPFTGGILIEDFLPFARDLRRKEREAAADVRV